MRIPKTVGMTCAGLIGVGILAVLVTQMFVIEIKGAWATDIADMFT